MDLNNTDYTLSNNDSIKEDTNTISKQSSIDENLLATINRNESYKS